jgi:hypothetical protein
MTLHYAIHVFVLKYRRRLPEQMCVICVATVSQFLDVPCIMSYSVMSVLMLHTHLHVHICVVGRCYKPSREQETGT